MHSLDALVTGASRGIGLALARAMLARDDVRRVLACARDPAASAALAALAAEFPRRVRTLSMDVTDERSVADAAGQARADDVALGAVFNVAGVLHDDAGMLPERRLADIDPEQAVRSYRVNALGPLLVAKHFAALLPRDGRCVHASLSARVGSIGDNRLGGWYAYRASKAAQNMFTRNLAIELRRRHRGVIVVALHPGTVATDLSAPFRGGVPEGKLFGVERAARQLLAVVDGLTPADNGGFFAWDGQPIPW